MGRPQLPLGTYGKVRIYPHGAGFQAMTNFRDYDGKSGSSSARERPRQLLSASW